LLDRSRRRSFDGRLRWPRSRFIAARGAATAKDSDQCEGRRDPSLVEDLAHGLTGFLLLCAGTPWFRMDRHPPVATGISHGRLHRSTAHSAAAFSGESPERRNLSPRHCPCLGPDLTGADHTRHRELGAGPGYLARSRRWSWVAVAERRQRSGSLRGRLCLIPARLRPGRTAGEAWATPRARCARRHRPAP